jgi:ribosomal protein S27AE
VNRFLARIRVLLNRAVGRPDPLDGFDFADGDCDLCGNTGPLMLADDGMEMRWQCGECLFPEDRPRLRRAVREGVLS